MSKYGTKGGDGASLQPSKPIRHSQPVCGNITYVLGLTRCGRCGTSAPIKGREGQEIRGARVTCDTCKTVNIWELLRFLPSN
jgi:hypothetical protein